MNSTHSYDREGFLSEFFPDATDRVEVEAGAQALVNVGRATAWPRCVSVRSDAGRGCRADEGAPG